MDLAGVSRFPVKDAICSVATLSTTTLSPPAPPPPPTPPPWSGLAADLASGLDGETDSASFSAPPTDSRTELMNRFSMSVSPPAMRKKERPKIQQTL